MKTNFGLLRFMTAKAMMASLLITMLLERN